MQSREIDSEIKELMEKDKLKMWDNFCSRCHNTEEVACEFCEYEGKGEPSEFQTFQDSLDLLNLEEGKIFCGDNPRCFEVDPND